MTAKTVAPPPQAGGVYEESGTDGDESGRYVSAWMTDLLDQAGLHPKT